MPRLFLVEWSSRGDKLQEHREAIVAAESAEEFEKEMQALLQQLKTSHTGFSHESARRISGRHAICTTLQHFEVGGTARWRFQDVHEGDPGAAAGIHPRSSLMRVAGKEAYRAWWQNYTPGDIVCLLDRKLARQHAD